jgi:hypothetical protein
MTDAVQCSDVSMLYPSPSCRALPRKLPASSVIASVRQAPMNLLRIANVTIALQHAVLL